MSKSAVHVCECPHCQQESAHADQELHRQMNLLVSRLDEQQRRGSGGCRVEAGGTWRRSLACSNHWIGRKDDPTRTARTGRLSGHPAKRTGSLARRWATEGGKKDAELESALLQLIEPETAGDPMSEQKWVRSSLGHLCQRLGNLGHRISPPTLAPVLAT